MYTIVTHVNDDVIIKFLSSVCLLHSFFFFKNPYKR